MKAIIIVYTNKAVLIKEMFLNILRFLKRLKRNWQRKRAVVPTRAQHEITKTQNCVVTSLHQNGECSNTDSDINNKRPQYHRAD